MSAEIICPWCGHQQSDPTEIAKDDCETVTIQCGECEKSIEVTCSIRISYYVQKVE
jgi:transcription elongation factor Elf1